MNRLQKRIAQRRVKRRKRKPRKPQSKTVKRIRAGLLEQDPHCWFCGRYLMAEFATLDHFRRPHSRGGTESPDNVVLCCQPCNNTKSTLPPEFFACKPQRGAGIVRIWEIPGTTVSFSTEITPMSDNVTGFNYDALDTKPRAAVKRHAKAIHGLIERTTESLVEIGRRLHDVRESLSGPGQFRAWIKAEFKWSQSTASNLMQIAEKFGHLDCLDHFQHSALYVLVRNNVDERAVKEAVRLAESGQVITHKRAGQIVVKYQDRPDQTDRPAALYELRGALRKLNADVNGVLAAIPPDEVASLADQLLDLAMQLRNAARGPQPTTASGPAKAKGTRRKRPAAA